MEYEEKTDLELNLMVAKIAYPNDEGWEVKPCMFGSGVSIIRGGVKLSEVDYLNRVSDCMSIVLANGLMVVSDDTFEVHIEGESLWQAHNRKGFHWHDVRYSKAAMIAFINLSE